MIHLHQFIQVVGYLCLAVTVLYGAAEITEGPRRRLRYAASKRRYKQAARAQRPVTGHQPTYIHVHPCGCTEQYQRVALARCQPHEDRRVTAAMERQIGGQP